MADIVFNVAKGRLAHYASLPGASDTLVWVPLEAAGLEADATLADHDTLAAVLAGTSNEQTTMGRVTATGVIVTVDDGTDTVTVGADDPAWPAATGNSTGKLLLCYDPTGSSPDADLVPLLAFDFAATPAGADVTAQVGDSGLVTIA